MSKNVLSSKVALVWALVLAGGLINSGQAMRDLGIVENNQYNTIVVTEIKGNRHLFINKNASSMYNDNGKKHEYIEFIERIALNPVRYSDTPKNILVLGAGAFTLGAQDTNNHYDFVDIDKSLKDIAEEHILRKPIGGNRKFHPVPARAFLTQTQTKYDVIVLDAFFGTLSVPEHLMTKEFFQQVKSRLKPDGKVLANMAMSPNFTSAISRNLDNTLRSVFPHISRHAVAERYDLWNDSETAIWNMIYIYKQQPSADAKTIYTDAKNTVFMDRPTKNRKK